MPQATLPHCSERIRHGTTPLAPPEHSVLGDWQLLELAAATELSELYRARSAGADGDRLGSYAIKVLREGWQRDAGAVTLMRREALVGRRTASAHVVAVLSASVAEPPHYLVMPWLTGETLKSRLAGWPFIPVHAALWIARQAATGLADLASNGWMHGDVKPENVLISPEGHATLLDLGFARRPGETLPAIDGWILGAAAYLAPEAFVERMRIDLRSDIYSLGVVLYEMLAGQPPFSGGSQDELARQHRETAPRRLAQTAPHVAPEVAALVHRMLAKDPLRRPQSPVELVDELTALEVVALRQWTA